MRINANVSSLMAFNNLTRANKKIDVSSQRLSGGVRINFSKDDPAGLAISNKMKSQIGGTQESSKNSSNGISLTQTADGGLAEIHSMLQRQRELTVQALNDSYGVEDIEKIQMEIDELSREITGIASKTEYNSINLLARGAYSRVTAVRPDPSTQYTTLGTNAVNPDGGFNFTATTPDGSLVNNLIYNPNNPTTSESEIRIKNSAGATIINQNIRSLPLTQSTTHNALNNSWETRYEYTNGSGVNVEVVQTVTIKNDPARGGQLYDIQYDIINNSTIDVLIDFSHDMDLYMGTQSYERIYDNPLIYDDNTGTETNMAVHYEGANVPNELSLRIPDNDNMNVICVFDDGSVNPLPDEIIFRNYDEGKWGWDDDDTAHVITDSGYNVIWWNENLTQGDTLSLRTQYGVTAPEYNPVIADNIEPEIVSPALIIHTGPNQDQNLTVYLCDARAEALDVADLQYGTHEERNESLRKIDEAISKVTFYRSRFGSYQNRLEHTLLNLDSMTANLETSLSRIQDTDMASESSEYAKNQVIAQAGISILAQANQRPQQILQLLG